MNIYFLHLLFLMPIREKSIYALGNPLLIFVVLLLSSLFGSVAINAMKQAVGVTNFEHAIRNAVTAKTRRGVSL